MENKLESLREKRSKLLNQWRWDRKRRFEILAAIIDIEHEISRAKNKQDEAKYH